MTGHHFRFSSIGQQRPEHSEQSVSSVTAPGGVAGWIKLCFCCTVRLTVLRRDRSAVVCVVTLSGRDA